MPLRDTRSSLVRFAALALILIWTSGALLAVVPQKKKKSRSSAKALAARNVIPKTVALNVSAARIPARTPTKKLSGPWRVPTYAESATGDFVDGDDLVVRRAAVDALGPLNRTDVVSDPGTGRILTIVNQKLAL